MTEAATVGELPLAEFESRLRGAGLGLRLGPFDICIRARVVGLYRPLHLLYRDNPVLDLDRPFSCHVDLTEVRAIRAGFKRMVRFTVDGYVPQPDLPTEQALAMLEWGLNLVIAMRFQCFLMLHAAVLERSGGALVLPAMPGAGKTTLCAGLAHRGWRLLSDEFGLMRPGVPQMLPIPRPMPLKNESIAVIRAFAPEAVVGPEIPGTRKGTVAHVRPPAGCVARAHEAVPPRWIVFPRWVAGAPLSIEELSRAEGFQSVATNAFNYGKHAERGFETVRDMVEGAMCLRLRYSNLEEAVAALTRLADGELR